MKQKENYISKFSLKLYNICQKYPIFRSFKLILYFIDWFLIIFIKKPKKIGHAKKKVLIIYNYAFGDGIIFLCSFIHIRKVYPKKEYEISLICQKGLQSIYEEVGVFDKVIPYNLTNATFNLKERYNLFKLLRQDYYDIVVDPIGVNECTTNIFMCRALCADEKVTIIDNKAKTKLCPKWLYNRIYTKVIESNIKDISLIDLYANVIRGLGYEDFKVKFEHFKSRKLKIDLPNKYFIVFPSASTLLKRWPLDRYAEIIKRVYKKTKLPVLFCGTSSDIEVVSKLKDLIKDVPQYDVINKTNLLEFIEVIKRAKFVITNDTSTYHIAVTNEVPVAGIIGGYTYDKYVLYKFEGSDNYRKPYDVVCHMDCFNCDNMCCKLKEGNGLWPCLNSITVDYAWKRIEEMIEKEVDL